jgi:succinylglutamic semialdehyde dehydrogenase
MISKNPATQEILWEGHEATPEEIKEGVKISKEVFSDWSKTSLEERVALMLNYKELLKKKEGELTSLISKETGKPLWEAKGEVLSMVQKIDLSIEAQNKRCPPELREESVISRVSFKPKGVLAVFGPYNFPGHLPNGHIVPALLAGNTILFKPSEKTPLVGQTLFESLKEAGFPKGVIQLIQGGRTVGHTLASSKEIDGILFTGSYSTGKLLSKMLSKSPEKILALEMGGNNPYILGDVTDLKSAALLTILSAYISSGQRCTCARRLILNEKSPFLTLLLPMIEKIKVGAYQEIPEPFMGPLITNEAADQVLKAQEILIEKGATPLLFSKRLKEGFPFLTPGVIDVTSVKNKGDEEIFGPLLQVIRVKNFKEALKEACKTKFGLAAGLLSDDEEEYRLFYKTVRAGVMNWNTPLTGASSKNPFGGFGKSGNHRPSAFFATDYCNSPVASLEIKECQPPQSLPPGLL